MTATTPHDQQGRLATAYLSQVVGSAAIGAGLIHAAAIGIHAEHPALSRLMVAVAVAQIAVGLVTLIRGGRRVAVLTALVNGAAVGAWLVTRVSAIPWIDGLERSEAPQFVDTVCAGLGAVAAAGAIWALLTDRTRQRASLGLPAVAVGALAVVAMLQGATHVHSHGDATDAAHHHDDVVEVPIAGDDDTHANDATASNGHPHGDNGTGTTQPGTDPASDGAEGEESAAAWPRPWDPTAPIDFSGVPGVTAEQQHRAEALVAHTLEVLPQFADASTLEALGYHSVGDTATGYEHYINVAYAFDDDFMDPAQPESLVYEVDGDRRTLVSAMYTAGQMAIDDPDLIDYGGPLMQWHVHNNLCWASNDGAPHVVALADDHGGTCPAGTVLAGGDIPMVHVWITRHECGPFAALEGQGAGQANAAQGQRVDQCAHDQSNDGHGGSTPR